MTEINSKKDQSRSGEMTDGKTTIANKNDDRKLNERADSTGARQARKASEDKDPFDNMPI